tara:strand:- start:90 stop:869 length:780 start_codon:yes stop_codon:yes gene_type:complete
MKLLVATLALLVTSGHGVTSQTGNQFFDSDGIKIRYTDEGEGSPVILVHGFTGSAGNWQQAGITQTLANTHRVIAIDCRGHGLSDKLHDPVMYGSHMALDILRLMDHLGLAKAHIVGYSMGARLTGYLVANHPDRLLTATLGASPPRRRWDASTRERANRMRRNMELRSRDADPVDGQDYIALATILRSWQSQVVTDQALTDSPVPTLAIVGSEDPRLGGLQELTQIMPELKLVILEGATHRSAVRRPAFVNALLSFIK